MKKYQTLMNKTVHFKKKQLFRGLIHLEFNSQQDLTSSLLRFQEYYESPKYRNKPFLFNEFYEWYKKTRNGKFSYLTDWAGFNFPTSILKVFLNGDMGNLTTREKRF